MYSRQQLEESGLKPKKLYRYEQLPSYLQSNPYLCSGYRAYLSKAECLGSIFKWTNETINIWSHLMGLILFTGFLIHDTVFIAPAFELTAGEITSMVFFDLCIMIALVFSVLYHTFSCHSEMTYQEYLKLDIDGIALAGSGAYVFGLHTTFGCFTHWHAFYQTINALFSFLMVMVQLRFKQKTPKDHLRTTVILTLWLAVGIILPFHLAYLLGSMQHSVVMNLFVQAVVYYMFMGGGFFFYLTRYPEKCCPGKVDYLGASHQIWHVLVLGGFTWWHQRCILNLEYRYNNACS